MLGKKDLSLEEKAKIAEKIKAQLAATKKLPKGQKASVTSTSKPKINVYFVISEEERKKLEKAKEYKAAKKPSKLPNPALGPEPIPEDLTAVPEVVGGVVEEELGQEETQTKRDREYKWHEFLKYKKEQREEKRVNEYISQHREERKEEESEAEEPEEKLTTQVSIKPLSEIVERFYGNKKRRIPGLKVRDSILDSLTQEMLASKQEKFEFTPEEKEIINEKKGLDRDSSEEQFDKLNKLINKKTKKYNSEYSVELEDAKGITFRSQKKFDVSGSEKYYKEIQQGDQPTIYETQIKKDDKTSKILFQEINDQTIETITDQEFKGIIKEATNLVNSNEAVGVKVTIEEDGVKKISKELLVQASLVGGESECKEVYLSLTELSERFESNEKILEFLKTFKEAAEASGFETYIFGMPDLEGEDNPHGTMITNLDDAIEILELNNPDDEENYEKDFEKYEEAEKEGIMEEEVALDFGEPQAALESTPKLEATATLDQDAKKESSKFIKLYDTLYEQEINKKSIDIRARNKDPIYQDIFKRYVERYRTDHEESRKNEIFEEKKLEEIYSKIKKDLFKIILKRRPISINNQAIKAVTQDVSEENLTRIKYKGYLTEVVNYYNLHDNYYGKNELRKKDIEEMQKFIYDKIKENLSKTQKLSISPKH